MNLTRRQQEIYEFLQENASRFARPPTLDELCAALNLRSRGSLHKHIQALSEAGLIEPLQGRQRGIRLIPQQAEQFAGIPFLGAIAAGKPIEAIPQPEVMRIPDQLMTDRECYILQIRGDSMIEAGIFNGDWVVVEKRNTASNGDIVVALINNETATLKKIEQHPDRIILYPANSTMEAMHYLPSQVTIQGVLVGLMRKF